MRVYLMLSSDVMYKPRLLADLLVHKEDSICGVAEVQNRRRRRGGLRNLWRNLGFWGVRGAAWLKVEEAFRKALNSWPVPSHLRNFASLKRVCAAFGVEYRDVSDVNDSRFLEHIRSLKPDIILSFQHQIFGSELLSLPTVACVNCHPAMLPEYRGVKPIFWAMRDDADRIGVTVHTMTPEIDQGAIVAQRWFRVRNDRTLLENYRLAYDLAATVILEAIDELESSETRRSLKMPDSATYYKFPTPTEIDGFRRLGKRVA